MTDDREREGWTYRVVDDEVEFCGPDPDLDVLTVPLSVVIAAYLATTLKEEPDDQASSRPRRAHLDLGPRRTG